MAIWRDSCEGSTSWLELLILLVSVLMIAKLRETFYTIENKMSSCVAAKVICLNLNPISIITKELFNFVHT